MRELIGSEVAIRVDGQTIKGTLMDEDNIKVVLQSSDGTTAYIAKNKIAMFMSKIKESIKPNLKSGLNILSVEDADGNMAETFYITDGGSLKTNERTFRRSCKIASATKIVDLGDLWQVDSKLLKKILGGMIISADE